MRNNAFKESFSIQSDSIDQNAYKNNILHRYDLCNYFQLKSELDLKVARMR